MPTSEYSPLVPTGFIPLNQDYLNLQNNFKWANISFGTDHEAFDSKDETKYGYHTAIHFVPSSTTTTNPPNNNPPKQGLPNGYVVTPGFGQLFSAEIKDGVIDDALFYVSGNGVLTQLTGVTAPSGSDNGYITLPGGIIMQWGKAGGIGLGGLVIVTLATNNIDFPNNLFNIQATMIRSSTNVDNVYAVTQPASGVITQLRFFDTSSGNPFYWVAIGK